MPTPVNPPSNFRYDLPNAPSAPPPSPEEVDAIVARLAAPAPRVFTVEATPVVAYARPSSPASVHPCTPPCKLGCRWGRSGPPRRARAAVRPKPAK